MQGSCSRLGQVCPGREHGARRRIYFLKNNCSVNPYNFNLKPLLILYINSYEIIDGLK